MEDHRGDIISTSNGGITDNEFSFYFLRSNLCHSEVGIMKMERHNLISFSHIINLGARLARSCARARASERLHGNESHHYIIYDRPYQITVLTPKFAPVK